MESGPARLRPDAPTFASLPLGDGSARATPAAVSTMGAPNASASGTSPPQHDTEVTRDGSAKAKRTKQVPRCRFYGTKRGCRSGDQCPFRHELSGDRTTPDGDPPKKSQIVNSRLGQSSATLEKASEDSHDLRRLPDRQETDDRAIARPIPQTQRRDPRNFQISQIVKRFSAEENTSGKDDSTELRFAMEPSDPDFPFDIGALQCSLRLAQGFPFYERPRLRVSNEELERGYQLNVERGFDALWSQSKEPTLLNCMELLDRRLEAILTAQKAETVKIVAHSGSNAAVPWRTSEEKATKEQRSHTSSDIRPTNTKTIAIERPYPKTLEGAREKRELETRALENRLGKMPGFSKAADGSLYTVPITPRRRHELPPSIRAVQAVRLFVPAEYGIEPCSVELVGVDGQEGANVEKNFAQRARERRDTALLAHVNYLSQNLRTMTLINSEPEETKDLADVRSVQAEEKMQSYQPQNVTDTEKSHVKIIARPPEWDDNVQDDEPSDDQDESSYASDSSLDETSDPHWDEPDKQMLPTTPRESGIALTFPSLELHNIELFTLTTLNLTVKCARCREPADLLNIKPFDPSSSSSSSSSKTLADATCRKCANPLLLAYRPDLMHASSHRAGYLDPTGCTPVDLLASSFRPTCAACSAAHPVDVPASRADPSLAICRACHAKMSFRLHAAKLAYAGPVAARAAPGPPRKRPPRSALGITPGAELPRRGACPHYRRSNRWFRFSCCARVFPCDRCHDAAVREAGAPHPSEFANRMICGLCSREQAYHPERCGSAKCGAVLNGRRKGGRSGFWEGGLGTRDRVRMNRNDPRKYRGRRAG